MDKFNKICEEILEESGFRTKDVENMLNQIKAIQNEFKIEGDKPFNEVINQIAEKFRIK